jgi:polysaccharide export outer membrane protein
MKMLRTFRDHGILFAGIAGIGLGLAGCQTAPPVEPVFSDPTQVAAAPAAAAPSPVPRSVPDTTLKVPMDTFCVGDMVTVTFSGVENPIAPHEERIKDDGTITLPLIGSVIATGKTPGKLQNEIQGSYVPKYYTRLVVTVKQLDRFFYVGGEVRRPERQLWLGEVTVTQAIQSAGGFTDFADKTKVQVTRADGSTILVNCKQALKRPKLDPKVLPRDSIHVPKRWL